MQAPTVSTARHGTSSQRQHHRPVVVVRVGDWEVVSCAMVVVVVVVVVGLSNGSVKVLFIVHNDLWKVMQLICELAHN